MRPVVVAALLTAVACRPPGYGREGTPDAAQGSPDAASSSDAGSDGTLALCEHAFRLEGHDAAASVWLTGNFIGWAGDPSSGAIAFTLGGDGAWTGSYAFMPGPHEYKFIVDGSDWITDPANPSQSDDGFGGKNSLYVCVP